MATLAGFTPLIATRIQDSSGTLLAAGSLNATPTDGRDAPINTVAGGVGGPLTTGAASFPVYQGQIGPAGLVPLGLNYVGIYNSGHAYSLHDVVLFTDGNYY